MSEVVGNRSTEEMEALLADGRYSFCFASADQECFYQLVKFENEFPYTIGINYNGPNGEYTQAYEESYLTLQNLIDYEPFDLSKFTIEEYRGPEE